MGAHLCSAAGKETSCFPGPGSAAVKVEGTGHWSLCSTRKVVGWTGLTLLRKGFPHGSAPGEVVSFLSRRGPVETQAQDYCGDTKTTNQPRPQILAGRGRLGQAGQQGMLGGQDKSRGSQLGQVGLQDLGQVLLFPGLFLLLQVGDRVTQSIP